MSERSDDRRRDLPDAAARRAAVDPSRNVVLEASAGTGKTRVLVERYVNLLLAGVDPDHILAITFTRKAAAEMRQRILERLQESARTLQMDAARWRDLRERFGDIAISTIDAFCLSLLREFPLEADVDPGFDLADETEVPRLVQESLDAALRICRALASQDEDVALVFAQLGERRLRPGLGALLDRRLVAPDVLRRFLQSGPRDLTAESACRSAASRLAAVLNGVNGGLAAFLADGPMTRPEFRLLADDLRIVAADALPLDTRPGRATLRALVDRLRGYFLTQDGSPRGDGFRGTPFNAGDCASPASWRRHRAAATAIAPAVAEAIAAYRRDLNAVMSRGIWRMYRVAEQQYTRTLEAHALLDFSGVLARALELLRQMDEFARSRYRLESRYHHVLVDEFQDTSRAQWELVALLVRSWGEGLGAAADAIPPSIFIVGDRKQSIYGFRDADVTMLSDAAEFIGNLRSEAEPARQAISVSFRSAPALLAFVNDVFGAIVGESAGTAGRRDRFDYREQDRFPIDDGPQPEPHGEPPVGLVVAGSVADAAEAVADEIGRLLSGAVIRDRTTGEHRMARAGDVAILFRTRDSHREYERSLERRGIATYVYKGLGFFDADEIQDAVALLRFLADPSSDMRAAALLRSRIVRLSDAGVACLAPNLAEAIAGASPTAARERLGDEDRRVLQALRAAIPEWLALVDRVSPSELLEHVLRETAYARELRGGRRLQARENLKKFRALVRRIQNRGYLTLARLAEHLDRLAVGDESNATIDAADAVSLMTVHAAKGLEFPIVFIVNVGRGTGGFRQPVRVAMSGDGEPSVAIADYQSEADEDSQAREREETKRLLYVALTRGRDRLYLSGTTKDGVFRAGAGSLAEVLPGSVRKLFEEVVAGTAAEVSWQGPAGAHLLTAVRHDGLVPVRPIAPVASMVVALDDVGPVTDDGAIRRLGVVTHVTPPDRARIADRSPEGAASSRMVGTLAHRFFRTGADRPRDLAWPDAELTEDERDSIVRRAAALAEALRSDGRVEALLASGRALFEVPFSIEVDARTIVRGAIDCLVVSPDGRVTVIELKTGAVKLEHGAQLELYVKAARALCPAAEVEGLLVYA